MKTVRAKFLCTDVEGDDTEATVTFEAVTAHTAENESWSKWTPSGSLSMHITNPAALDLFEAGVEYYLDVTRAED